MQVFEDVSAEFPNGTITALVGPSGSGKSTMLSAMAGYTRLAAGEITFVTDDGSRLPPDGSLITWIPQGSNGLVARTVIDNVMIGPLSEGFRLEVARQKAFAALDEVKLSRLADVRFRVISGGERQRVGFARALASSKPFIFADEPSASLDLANTENIADLLRDLRARATIVVATHDESLVAAAEHVVHMRSVAR